MENVYVLDAVKERPEFKFAVHLHVAKALAITCAKIATLGIIGYNIMAASAVTQSQQVIPLKIENYHPVAQQVRLTPEQITRKRTTDALTLLGCPADKVDAFALSCVLGAQVPQVDPVLIACIMWTESRFKPAARSSMGYKGVMQTPTATGYIETDTMHGCNKLRDHLLDTHGELTRALTNYKGSKRPYVLKHGRLQKSEGYKQALEVLELYKTIKKRI